jgi:F0F1-type ATP synthase membrane subunit b/b'
MVMKLEPHKGEKKEMKVSKLLVALVMAFAMLCTGLVFAQKKPAQNVSGKRHPNLAAAQKLSAQAYEKIVAAQKANEWDMEGHAQKAKDLLDQANQELKQAAEAANQNHK